MFSWSYVVTFDDSVTRQQVVDALDAISAVSDWYTCMPNTVFVVASLTATDLYAAIEENTGVKYIYVADCDTDRNGWLPRAAWALVKRKPSAV